MSPLQIALLYAVLATGFLITYLRFGQRVFLSLFLMAAWVVFVYGWIWFGNPPIEKAREASRWLWFVEGGAGIALLVTYLRKRRP